MKIGEVLAKVTKGEDLTDAEKTFLGDYKEPDIDAAANARSKREREKLEKQAQELEDALEQAKEDLEAAKAGNETEGLQKKLEKAQAKLEAQQAALEAEQAAHQATQRATALRAVKVPWIDGVPQKYMDTVLAEAFDGVDTADLSDAKIIEQKVGEIVQANESLIRADVGSGTGTGDQHRKPSGDKSVLRVPTGTALKNLSSAEGKKMIDSIWAADTVTRG